MSRTMKRLLMTSAGAIAAAVLFWAFALPRVARPDEDDDQKEAVQTPSRVSVQNGTTTITLDSQAQTNLGLEVATLQARSMRESISASALALPVQDLLSARRNYLQAENTLARARIQAAVSRREWGRINALYHDNQNASQKALEAAQGASRSGEAAVRAAAQDVSLQAAAVGESWGSEVEKWVADGSPELDLVLANKEMLVQVTMPIGQISAAPREISLELPGAGLARATLISPFPRVDPRIQGASHLYSLAARPGLAPQMNLVARLPVGPITRGVMVPASAVVWWQGGAWAYVQSAPTLFVRRAIIAAFPTGEGYWLTQGISPGAKIVVRGAQMLLSEEFRPPAASAGEGDND